MASKSCCGGSSPSRKTKQVKCNVTAASNTDQAQSSCNCDDPETLTDEAGCDCGNSAGEPTQANWITGYIQTVAGEVPQVSTKLDFSDTFGSWKCRWSIGRMDYKVEPGMYCVGSPDEKAPVLVTANYKMTFDRVREQLSGLDLWILVLDTDGVNVWCAAGKGTFGTEELINRIAAVDLTKIVSHRTLILPQLSAVGVAAHDVKKRSGFRVIYGTIRAKDIKAFLSAGMVATEEMRTVKFGFTDRLVLTPMELVATIKPIVIVFGVLFILNAIGLGHYSIVNIYALLGAVLVGCVLAPVLLPWIPGKAFSFKGFLLGLIWAVGVNLINGFPAVPAYSWLKAASYILILPSLSSFYTMNFTGSSTFTSLSGVDKEMKIALPTMLIATVLGIILSLVNDFISL